MSSTGATTSTGGDLGSGGTPAAGGGASTPPDCSGIVRGGFELCESGADFCTAVYENGEGCDAVCAAAGLVCETAAENIEGQCAADTSQPAPGCDSGHQSDFCLCRDPAGGGGGNSGSGGASNGTGGGLQEPMFPPPGATEVCPDPSLRFRFDAPPVLGSSGEIRVHDATNGSVVASINMGLPEITDNVGGSSFKQPRPVYVHGNEAIFVLPSAGLGYGKTYYVTMDSGVLSGPDGAIPAITDDNEWRFSTATAAPANKSSLRVAVDGTGQFCTIQGAVNAATTGTNISVGESAYYGVVYFTDKADLSIVGDNRDTTIIAGVNNNNLNSGTRARALVGLEHVSDFLIENVTIENQTPQGGSQAEALAMLSCDKCIVRNTTVRSLQDTLLWSGRIYAEDCLIEGNVDYIWGTGTAYFNRCEIKTVGRKGYNLQARNGADNYGYVFVDSKLTSDPGITGDVLARIDVTRFPSSHVAYIDCEMGGHISPAGWAITGGGSTASLRFWEYKSRNPQGGLIDTSGRASGSRQLSDSEAAQMRAVANVLGGWDPTQ